MLWRVHLIWAPGTDEHIGFGSCRDRVVYVGTFFQVYFASLGPGPPGLKIIMDVDVDTGQ